MCTLSAITPSSWRTRRTGFSLLELLIVIVLLSIFVLLAIPTAGDTQRSILRSAADLLQGDLAVAQIESIAHRNDVRVVVFNKSISAYHLAAASDTATPITHPVSGGPYAVQFGTAEAEALAGVTISDVGIGGDDELKFGIYGELDQATDATVTLALDGISITLTIDADTGEASIGPIVE